MSTTKGKPASAVPPNAAHDAGYLARRLRRQLPGVKIAVGLWAAGETDRAAVRERLAKLGVDEVLTRIADAADALRRLADGGGETVTAAAAKRSAQLRRPCFVLLIIAPLLTFTLQNLHTLLVPPYRVLSSFLRKLRQPEELLRPVRGTRTPPRTRAADGGGTRCRS